MYMFEYLFQVNYVPVISVVLLYSVAIVYVLYAQVCIDNIDLHHYQRVTNDNNKWLFYMYRYINRHGHGTLLYMTTSFIGIPVIEVINEKNKAYVKVIHTKLYFLMSTTTNFSFK